MFWRYGIFCSLFAGSIWGVFWQVIFTMVGILTIGSSLSLQLGPIFFSGAVAGVFYLFLQEKISLTYYDLPKLKHDCHKTLGRGEGDLVAPVITKHPLFAIRGPRH